jgi:RNA polymerase sigma-70 factor (ECF subfamily)
VDAACLDAFQQDLDYIHASLRRLGVPPCDVEDLAQEVFVALRSSWARCDHTRPLRPYLFGIAFRLASVHRRKRQREVPFGGIDAMTDASADLDEAMQSMQARVLILAALDRVPLRRRAVLLMHDLDDVPVADIASVLGIRLFTAYGRLRKARLELASALRRLLTRTSGEVLAHTLPLRVHVGRRA